VGVKEKETKATLDILVPSASVTLHIFQLMLQSQASLAARPPTKQPVSLSAQLMP